MDRSWLQNRKKLLAGEDVNQGKRFGLAPESCRSHLVTRRACYVYVGVTTYLTVQLRQARLIWVHVFRDFSVHPGREGMAKWLLPEKAKRMVEACSHGSGPGNRDQGGSLENLTFQCLSLVIYPASQAPPPKGSTASNTALRAEGQSTRWTWGPFQSNPQHTHRLDCCHGELSTQSSHFLPLCPLKGTA